MKNNEVNSIMYDKKDNNDVSVRAESSFIDPAVKCKQELIDWILVMLGAPLITVELTDTQINACIQMVLDYYTKYAYFGPDKYLTVDLTTYEHDKGLNLEGFNIASVKDISTPRENMLAANGDLFWGPYAFLNQGNGIFPFNNRGGTNPTMGAWVTWHMVNEYFELCHRMTGNNPDFLYDKNTKYLKLMPEPPHAGVYGRYLLLTCLVMPPYHELFGNEWVKRACLARCKMLLGTVRKKFSSVQLIGGGQLDTSIGDEGKEEWEKLADNIMANEARGQCWFIA